MTSEDIIEKETDTDMSATPPQIPVNPEIVTTTSLESLQSDSQRKIMDIVDKLKRGEPPRNPDKIIKMQVAADIK